MFSLKEINSNIVVNILLEKIDFDFIQKLKNVILSVNSTSKTRLILDMSQVLEVDNDFFDFLFELNKKTFINYKQINLSGLKSNIMATCYILNCDRFLSLYDNSEDALEEIQPFVRRNFKLV